MTGQGSWEAGRQPSLLVLWESYTISLGFLSGILSHLFCSHTASHSVGSVGTGGSTATAAPKFIPNARLRCAQVHMCMLCSVGPGVHEYRCSCL